MRVIALTGGIGSGKSSVASELEALSFFVIDADEVSREIMKPGSPTYSAVISHFGNEIVTNSGAIDRRRLAEIVFFDPDSLSILNALSHPAIFAHIEATIEEMRKIGSCRSVFVVVPLLAELKNKVSIVFNDVIVVDSDEALAIDRLCSYRQMSHDQAVSRIRAQARRPDRLKIADYIILNDGTLVDLKVRVHEMVDNLELLP